jgi:hypothetical protein
MDSHSADEISAEDVVLEPESSHDPAVDRLLIPQGQSEVERSLLSTSAMSRAVIGMLAAAGLAIVIVFVLFRNASDETSAEPAPAQTGPTPVAAKEPTPAVDPEDVRPEAAPLAVGAEINDLHTETGPASAQPKSTRSGATAGSASARTADVAAPVRIVPTESTIEPEMSAALEQTKNGGISAWRDLNSAIRRDPSFIKEFKKQHPSFFTDKDQFVQLLLEEPSYGTYIGSTLKANAEVLAQIRDEVPEAQTFLP